MALLCKAVLLASFALSATALMTPHAARHNHHDLAARVANPELVAKADSSSARRKRATQTCAFRTPTPFPTSAVSSAPVNVASSPVISSSFAQATSTHEVTSTPVASSSQGPSTSSTHAVPPSSSEKSSPAKPTTTSAPKTTLKHSSAAAPTSSASSGSGDCSEDFLCGSQTGQGTYYATGLGACGITNVDTDYICAVSYLLFDNYPGYAGGNPNNNPVCGQKITATYEGKSVTVTVTDRCTGCAETSLDFSPSAFENLADLSIGRLFGMTWVWS